MSAARTLADAFQAVDVARSDARHARDHALATHESVGALAREVSGFRGAVNRSLDNLHGKVDALLLDMRELRTMRPKLDSIAELDLAGLTEAQARDVRRAKRLRALGRYAIRLLKAAGVGAVAILGGAVALWIAHSPHLPIPSELVKP